jgi:hypothetical protein
VRPAAKIAAAVVFVGLATALLFVARALHGLRDSHPAAPTARDRRVAEQLLAVPLRRPGTGQSTRARLAGFTIERRFVTAYLRFLDGIAGSPAWRYASITARDDAVGGGRLPADLRDGALRLRSVKQSGATSYSAQATVVVGNREVSFPFTVSLIREHDGWWVADVQPPDFDVARPAPSPRRSAAVPAAARSATARFARGYLRHLADGRLPRMTATARSQVRLGEDSLPGTRLPTRTTVRLVRVQYGPFERDRFAVTVTADAADRQLRFTLLMLRTPHGWECDAFL